VQLLALSTRDLGLLANFRRDSPKGSLSEECPLSVSEQHESLSLVETPWMRPVLYDYHYIMYSMTMYSTSVLCMIQYL
jgi:hypothetical protein